MKFTNEQQNEFELIMESTPRKRISSVKVYNVGINDSSFQTSAHINGNQVKHRAYSTWKHMLGRCYSKKCQDKQKTYIGCSVCDEWLVFSNFYSWWKENHVDGWELDKDLLISGNKIYSPDRCLYVPVSLNLSTVLRDSARGDYPLGVYFCKGKFKAQIGNGVGSRIFLGYYTSMLDAHKAWLDAKLEIIKERKELCDSIHPNLYDGIVSIIKRKAAESCK